MKKLHLCLLLSLTVLSATAQKVYFIYIQTESEQPFFVKMNGKIQSSAASGYIILSKLVDSTYSFSIGFPQGKWAEQNFSVSVNKKDHGFLLKNFGEKGWGLFDLQTMVVQMAVAGNASADTKPEPEKNEVSAFTEILSRAADDPSLKERPVQPKKEEKKAEITVQEVAKKEELKVEAKESVTPGTIEVVEAPVAKTETPKTETAISKPADVIEQTSAKKDELKTEVKEQATTKSIEVAEKPLEKKEEVRTDIKEQPTTSIEAAVTEVYKTSQVKKWAESSTTEGFGLVFIDDYDNGSQIENTYKNIDIAYSPNIIAGAGIDYVLFKKTQFTLNGKYVGKQYLDNTQNEMRKINAYSYLNFRVTHTFKGIRYKSLNIGVQINNILNNLYEANGYTYSYKYGGELVTENFFYPQAGINYMVLCNIKF